MTLFQHLAIRAAEQHGYVTVADALDAGATRMALVMLARRGALERVSRGLYRLPDLATGPHAQLQEAVLRIPGAVLSHESALEAHDLADVNPRQVHVTVPERLRVRKALPYWLVTHHADLPPGDVDEVEGIPTVTPTRAILDAITDNLGARFVDQALATARRRNLLTTPEEERILAVRRRREEHQR